METLEEDDTKSKNIGLNIEAVANYNGTPIYDLNLDTITDKPWRKPGADITDYFNYGFNEETWKIYCEKQKKILSDIIGCS
uniref:Pre-mRNA polyadenylation factor Fip1 domain-containing protein n=1 Tax=Tetranychus urticae TaxID=32264 RepID=T1K0D5_TETUR